MDRTAILEKLNEILKWEYSGVLQYTQFSFVVQGVEREVYTKFFRENGEEALGHAHRVGDKIVALGGVPSIERAQVKQATDLHQMLEYSLEIEARHVQLYTEALGMLGDRDVALRVMLEDICLDEQEGVDHLEKILRKRELVAAEDSSTSKKVG
jgi:bacterioferritin